MKFPVPGVLVVEQPDDVCSRRFCSISLGKLSSRSSGTYKCEISGDAPTFNVVFESRNMTVYGTFHCQWVGWGAATENRADLTSYMDG